MFLKSAVVVKFEWVEIMSSVALGGISRFILKEVAVTAPIQTTEDASNEDDR